MKKKAVYILLFSVAAAFFIWTGFLWRFFSHGFAGSYPYIETWDLKVPESELIEIIKTVKKEHPELQPPGDTALTDGRYSYWYYIDFYYPDTKEIVHTWIRANDDTTSTTLALDAFSPYTAKQPYVVDSLRRQLGDTLAPEYPSPESKTINKDFGYFENKREIKKFENTIIHLLKEKIKN